MLFSSKALGLSSSRSPRGSAFSSENGGITGLSVAGRGEAWGLPRRAACSPRVRGPEGTQGRGRCSDGARVLSRGGWVLGPPRAVCRLRFPCGHRHSPSHQRLQWPLALPPGQEWDHEGQDSGARMWVQGQEDGTVAWELRVQDRALSPGQSTRPNAEHTAPDRTHGPTQSTRLHAELTAPHGTHGPTWSTRPHMEHMSPHGAQGPMRNTWPHTEHTVPDRTHGPV